MANLEKVTAFILRPGPGTWEVVLFEHPTAGIQFPAGTVEEGEAPEAAVLREGGEESGLTGLKLESFIGSIDEHPVIGDHFVARATPVYSRPNPDSFNWAHLRSGVTVRLLRRSNGYVHVSYQEPDRWPDSEYTTYQITGWIPEDTISETARRYFYILSHHGQTPPRWEVAIDNHIFKPFWAPLNAPPEIIAPQAPWLEILRKHIGDSK
jgi:8-oxo-dGTP pyrophosphatase MutT (NUDIX family)